MSAASLPFLTALKGVLRTRGWTYARLAEHLGVSEVTVKRWLSRGTCNLRQLEQVLALVEADWFEVGRRVQAAGHLAHEMSLPQEAALAEDDKLLLLFHLLLHDWTVAAILADYHYELPEITGLLLKLDKLGILDLLPDNRVRLRVSRHFNWRVDGPVRKRYQKNALVDFLVDQFDQPEQTLRFEVRELSAASAALMRRRLQQLARELTELAEADASLPAEQRQNHACLLAMRPWTFALTERFRRDKPA